MCICLEILKNRYCKCEEFFGIIKPFICSELVRFRSVLESVRGREYLIIGLRETDQVSSVNLQIAAE